jgi:hypothetical protein
MANYSEQWPHLAKITNNLEPRLVSFVGGALETYSTDVRIDYEDYIRFIQEYSDWCDTAEENTRSAYRWEFEH